MAQLEERHEDERTLVRLDPPFQASIASRPFRSDLLRNRGLAAQDPWTGTFHALEHGSDAPLFLDLGCAPASRLQRARHDGDVRFAHPGVFGDEHVGEL